MKRLIVATTLLLTFGSVCAQENATDKKMVEIEKQVSELIQKNESLQQSLSSLQQTVSALEGKVEQVISQNLSLKKALHLQPTISEITSPKGINYRLLSAKGNSQTGNVTFLFSVVNETKRDIRYLGHGKSTLINENGQVFGGSDYKSVVKEMLGNKDRTGSVILYPDTPVEMEIVFALPNESQYAKLLELPAHEEETVRIVNIPIVWE